MSASWTLAWPPTSWSWSIWAGDRSGPTSVISVAKLASSTSRASYVGYLGYLGLPGLLAVVDLGDHAGDELGRRRDEVEQCAVELGGVTETAAGK
jgi:hypothetical protein